MLLAFRDSVAQDGRTETVAQPASHALDKGILILQGIKGALIRYGLRRTAEDRPRRGVWCATQSMVGPQQLNSV